MDPDSAERSKDRIVEMIKKELVGEEEELVVVEEVVEPPDPGNNLLANAAKKIKMDRKLKVCGSH